MTTQAPKIDSGVIFFESQDINHGPSSLKEFLLYLKVHKYPRPFRFSHVDVEGTLLPGLSLKENISLDAIPSTFSSHHKFSLQQYLEKHANPHICELYKCIDLYEDLPLEVDHQTRKIAAIVKALLQSGDYIFMDRPEEFLDEKYINLIFRCLAQNLKINKQTLLIKSKKIQMWRNLFKENIKTGQIPMLEAMIRDNSLKSA